MLTSLVRSELARSDFFCLIANPDKVTERGGASTKIE